MDSAERYTDEQIKFRVFYVVPAWAFHSTQNVNLGEWLRQNVRCVTIGHRGQSDLQERRTDVQRRYIEVKKPGEKPRQNQQDFITAMRNSGALVGVAHSVEEAVGIVSADERWSWDYLDAVQLRF